MQPGRRRAGLGDAEVQRVVGRLGEQPVGLDHQRHVRRLHRDLHVVEADLVEVGELVLRRLDHRLGRDCRRTSRTASGSSEPALTPMRIGTPRSLASLGHGLDVLGLADVAGVEAQAVHAGLERGERHACTGSGCRRRSAPASGARSGPAPRPPLPRCTCSARCRSRRRRARRSARACRRRRPSWWWSSTARVTGASPPTATGLRGCASTIWRVWRRGVAVGRGDLHSVRRFTGLAMSRKMRRHEEQPEQQDHDVRDRHQLGHVGVVARPALAPIADLLVDGDGDVAAVERQQRHQVEDAEEDVDAGEQAEQRRQPARPATPVPIATIPRIDMNRLDAVGASAAGDAGSPAIDAGSARSSPAGA